MILKYSLRCLLLVVLGFAVLAVIFRDWSAAAAYNRSGRRQDFIAVAKMSGFYSDLENQIGPPNAQIDKEWLSLLKKELERNGIEVLDSDKWKLYRSRENSVDFVHIVHVRGDEIVGLYEHRPSSEIIAD